MKGVKWSLFNRQIINIHYGGQMEKIYIKNVNNVTGFKSILTSESFGRRSTILAPNSFGKTSLANAIVKRSLGEIDDSVIEVGIIKDGVTFNDLNVMLFNKNTIIDSIITHKSKITIGYELKKRNETNELIEQKKSKIDLSKKLLTEIFGGGDGRTIAKICEVKASNISDFVYKLYESYDGLGESNVLIESDLKNIYKDFFSGKDSVLNKQYVKDNNRNSICEVFDENLSKSIKKYINDMMESKCKLPSECPICGSTFESWDSLLEKIDKNLALTNQQGEEIQRLVDVKFDSKLLNDIKLSIIHEIIEHGKSDSSKRRMSELKQNIANLIIYHLNSYGTGDSIKELRIFEKELRILERHNLSQEQLDMIKYEFEQQLRLFNKTHISINVSDDSEVQISFNDGTDILGLSESEKNLISMIFFTNYIKYNKENGDKQLLLVFDDPLDSYDENYFEEISCMLSKIIDDSFCIILTHSLHAVTSLSKANDYKDDFYYMYDDGGKVKSCKIHQDELKALNKYGGDYGLCEYWYKDDNIKKKNELILIGGSSILRNSVEFIKKFWKNSEHHNVSSCANKLTDISSTIYVNLCNVISHYRGSSSRISSLQTEVEKVFGYSNKGVFVARYVLVGKYKTVDNIIKDILADFSSYETNKCFSNIILRRFTEVLYIKRNLENNLRNIAFNNGVNMITYSTKDTLGSQVEFLISVVPTSSLDYPLLRNIELYKNRYNNLINDFSHSSNRMLPPFLLIRNHVINDALNDLGLIPLINFI